MPEVMKSYALVSEVADFVCGGVYGIRTTDAKGPKSESTYLPARRRRRVLMEVCILWCLQGVVLLLLQKSFYWMILESLLLQGTDYGFVDHGSKYRG